MHIKERVKTSLLAVMTGDALGMPFETMKPEEILAATGGKGVLEMHDPVQRRISDTQEFKRGMSTDDWQFSWIVGDSLARRGRFDLVDQARAHVRVLDDSALGMGGTTLYSLCELAKHFRIEQGWHAISVAEPPSALVRLGNAKHLASWAKAQPRRPEFPAPPRAGKNPGIGNGVAMKITPLALFHAVRKGGFEREPLLTDAMDLGRMTHSDLRASIGAYAVAVVIAKVLHQPLCPVEDIDPDTDGFLDEVIAEVRLAEARYSFVQNEADSISRRLMRMKAFYRDSKLLRENVGSGGSTLESVPFAIGTFLRRYGRLTLGLREAVEAGGDTDTNAAIAGAMIGANLGFLPDDAKAHEQIPDEWRSPMVCGGLDAFILGDRLYEAAKAL